MKKRILSLILACGLVTGCMAGCGQQEQQTSKESESQAEVESSSQAEVESSSVDGATEEVSKHPITTEPITIKVLTARQQEATNDATDLWNFKYLEYWMNQQGYNITIEPVQSTENSTVTTLLQTDRLPDLVMGFQLDPAPLVMYGAEEGMIMDWAPYLNEEYMPNTAKLFEGTGAIESCMYEGALYGLPYYTARLVGEQTFSYGTVDRIFLNTTLMEELGIKDPANIDEFLDMLRRFKNEIKLEDGQEFIPYVGMPGISSWIWAAMGYYSNPSCYGYDPAIKNGEIVLPGLEDDFRTYVEILHTMYEEGLISPDYFTLDKTAVSGMQKAGQCGVMTYYTMENADNHKDWKTMEPFTIGDAEEVVYSNAMTYDYPRIWASSDFEYPEVLAYMIDYIYSEEGSMYWRIGPKQGEDPLGLVDGWYFDEDGNLTTKLVADGTYASFEAYCRQYIYAHDFVGELTHYTDYAYKLAGLEKVSGTESYTDVITGETVEGQIWTEWTDEDNAGWWRISSSEAAEGHLTTVQLPKMMFLTEEELARRADLRSMIAKELTNGVIDFVTGARDLSEIEKFQQELIEIGAEEYLEINKKAYSEYMSNIFD